MASQSSEHLRPQQGHQRRPRLAYRTKSGDVEYTSTIPTGISNPTSPSQSDPCHSPRFPPSLSSETSSSSSSWDPSISATSTPPKSQSNMSKKRSGFLSGLLGAKEPSAQALAAYEKQLLKQGNGRVTAVGLAGISSAKLPPTVPKTNSKWDGVPQTAKEKEKHHDKAKRFSSSGLYRTTNSADSMKFEAISPTARSGKRQSRGGGSVHSNGSRNNLADLYGWETKGCSSAELVKDKDAGLIGSRPSTSATMLSLDAPALQRDSRFPPQGPPEMVPTDITRSPPVMSGALTPPEHSDSPTLTPYDPSPATPGAVKGESLLHDEGNTDDYFRTTILEVPTFGTEVIVKSAGVNVLGPPATAKRRQKPSAHQSFGEGCKIQEVDFQLNSILKKEPAGSKKTSSSRPATTNSPKTPAQHDFTRKGLGLAGNLKNQGAAPSLSPRPIADETKEERSMTPTPEDDKSARRKSRMSLFAH